MPYEPLHHKYRPQTFAELVGQEAISKTITNAIISRKIAPAYLFAGPRGTGKTSSARILAKSLNCLKGPTPMPCGQCDPCRAIARGSALDIVEIDAASNTGVDNIREVIERAQFAPVQCRYKVYVIDECHMLSTAAFNALLKTLEEPPEQVVFVLATTDPQRVLPTIISRCQRFDFRRIPLEPMVAHLKKIADLENIEISDTALFLVAQIANGGLRDAQSLLEQLSLLSGTITPERVWDLVGAVPERDLLVLLEAIASNDPEAVLEQCRHLINRGREPLIVLQDLAGFYLNLLIAKTAPMRADMVAVTEPTWKQLCTQAQHWELSTILKDAQHLKESEGQLKNTAQPHLWLEVSLLGLLPSACEQPSGQQALLRRDRSYEEGAGLAKETGSLASESVVQRLGRVNTEGVQSVSLSPISANTTEALSVAQADASQSSSNTRLLELDAEKTSTRAYGAESGNNEGDVSSIVPEARSQPQATASASVESSVPAPPVPVAGEQIWPEMLKHLHPPTTQALLSQHCHLIGFDGAIARIGIKNRALLGIAQSKLTNVRAAFEAACHQKIEVKLQVSAGIEVDIDTPPTVSARDAAATGSPPPEPIATSQVTAESARFAKGSSQVIVPAAGIPLEKDAPREPYLDNLAQARPGLSAPLETDGADVEPLEVAVPPRADENAANDRSEEECINAAQRLAKYFDGEIVTLSDPVNSPSETFTAQSDLESSPPSQNQSDRPIIRGRPNLADFNDDEDIPFLRPASLDAENLQDIWELNANKPGTWLRGARDLWL